jgi:hypothetical protein
MTENPYESTDQPHGVMGNLWARIFWRVVIYGGIIALVVALLLPNVRGGRESARRATCITNFKQITLALLNYHDKHGEFPPAYTVDADGNRLHSWRSLILPHLEGHRVYEMIDFTKPWDAPENERARSEVMHAYVCPSASSMGEQDTIYVAVVGPEFLFSGSTPRKMDEITDGIDRTVALVEISQKYARHWMSPDDIDEEFLHGNREVLNKGHMGLVHVGFADGHVDHIDAEIESKDLRPMLTTAGADEVDE